MAVLLEIRGLSLETKDYPGKKLVEDISFKLEEGKILGLVGESGSGKSLTALSIMRLLPPNIIMSSGTISVYPQNQEVRIDKLNPDLLHDYRGNVFSMIFQEPMTSLNPSMTCGKQVEEAIISHRKVRKSERRKRMISLLNEVKLPEPGVLIKRYPHQLSGGQRQRVMIAMALASDPLILIADEPTTALDTTVQKTIIELLLELKARRNLSILFISHDLRLIREIADNVLVMQNGKMVENNSSEKLFRSPEKHYTQGLIACQTPVSGKPIRLPTINSITGLVEKSHEIKADRTPVIYSAEPLLKVENLSVIYKDPGFFYHSENRKKIAVNNLSLEIYKGETLGLVGESGCGKTTLGKTILRLIESSCGNIFFKGKNISTLTGIEMKRFRKSVQVVFQDPFSSLNPIQTVQSSLDEVLRIHQPGLGKSQRNDRIAEILIRTGLEEDDRFKYPHQFSGGQRQRVCIARSLSTGPELLILDESVSALDVSIQAQILNLLNDLKEEFHLSYLFISHDLSVVKYMSDKLIVMRDGKIEEEGEPEKIFSESGNEYTRLLIHSIPGYQYSTASTS